MPFHTMDSAGEIIRDTIRSSGPLPFEQFMDMALYYPGCGYYTSGGQRIGTGGDYYTAPYASSILGILIARQIAELFDLLGNPSPFQVVEVGAGSGSMADDIVEASARWHPRFHAALRYVAVERHPIPAVGHAEKITVRESLTGMEPFTGCIVSNELFDALPVHVVVMKDRLYEVYVDVRDGRFEEILLPASATILGHFEALGIRPAEGMRTEVNLKARDMLRDMAEVLSRGYVLTIDYGYTAHEYYAPHRSSGTLVCFHNHLMDSNPYELVGTKDITSHVDFTSLARWGRQFSLETVGFVRQGDFVMSLGYDDLLAQIKQVVNDPITYYRMTSASKFLILPDAMGDIFKVMLQQKGSEHLPLPAGFAFRNSIPG